MELHPDIIQKVLHPTAAFSPLPLRDTEPVTASQPWQTSLLNPKNRIDSLELPRSPLWRIDGCIACGTQYFAVPLFLDDVAPNRVDVFISVTSQVDAAIRDALDLNIAFHTRDTRRVRQLAISRHLVRCLDHWTRTAGGITREYAHLPFGSRIIFRNLPADIRKTDIVVAPAHYLERQMLSAKTLQALWSHEVVLPPSVDLRDLVYLAQPHDSVSLVRHDEKTWVFKALTSYTKYLYHELRYLLRIPKHPSILARPPYIVTKKCGFGSKVAVVGFLAEYHVNGSLRDHLPFFQIHDLTTLAKEVKWSLQITSAMVHLRKNAGLFYPDLRLDNIVLSETGDLVMVDFEQRGVWCEFAAPEVNAIDYVRILATEEDLPQEDWQKYANILSGMLPGWETLCKGEDYNWPVASQGYNIPWLCLTPREQEACEVYMLGRVLWCIFEAKSSPQSGAAWASYMHEPLTGFPSYERTPPEMIQLIEHCTRGRRSPLSDLIVRRQGDLTLRRHEVVGRAHEPTPYAVQAMAKSFWRREIKESERWLQDRAEGMKDGTWKENYYDRPGLQEVSSRLASFYERCCNPE